MYSTESIRQVYSLSRSRLASDLSRAGYCGPFTGWSMDELISTWLGYYGRKADR